MRSYSPCWRLETHTLGDHAHVRLVGERVVLAEADALSLRAALYRLAETGPARLTLDLGNVSYLTSTTVETFLAVRRKLKEAGGRLFLSNLTPAVAEILAVLQLDGVLGVHAVPPDIGLRN